MNGEKIEVPAWLRAKIDQRLALMAEVTGGPENFTGMEIVAMTLTEPGEDCTDAEFTRWERTCDSCGNYCPPAEPFYSGQRMEPWGPTKVLIIWGECHPCKVRDAG